MAIAADNTNTAIGTRLQPKGRSMRFWELDALRGIAVVMMVVYHLMYDLYFFVVTDAIFTNRFWFYFQRTTATLFIVLVGVSLALRSNQRGGRVRFASLAKRGATIFLWGMLISIVTYFALGPAVFIRFGILHFIGLSVILAYPFLGYRWFNLALGVMLIAVGVWLQQFSFGPPWSYLFWIGLEPANHTYVDFFPLIRWFGVVLIGIALGNLLYEPHGRKFSLPPLAELPPISLFAQMGQRSLAIYLVHQPILFAILILILLLLGVDVVRF